MNHVVVGKIRVGLAAALFLAAAPTFGADQHFQPVEWLEARGVETSESVTIPGGRIDIVIERWSSDEEAETLRTALNEGPDRLLEDLQKMRRRAGVLWFPGQRGALGARARTRRTQGILFAREITTPTCRHIILATDEHLDLGQLSEGRRPRRLEFALIDIRLDSNGKGVGKVALASQVAYNKKTKILELGNYELQAVRLDEVRRKNP